jgi:hypothetical protein
MFSTDPAIRDQFITGLRQLADYLATHPDVPVPPHGATITVHADSFETGGKTQVDTMAEMLGADVQDDTADDGHYRAERAFNSVGYGAVSIPEARTQRYRAHASYWGCVTPDTWTASA